MTREEALATINIDAGRSDVETEALIANVIAHGVGADEVATRLGLTEYELMDRHALCVRHAG